MTASAQDLQHRRKLLRLIKTWVRGYVGPEAASLKRYSLPYQREFYGRWRASTADDLFRQVAASRIVFGADFHGFSQAQRTHLRILRSLPSGKRVVLALEIFERRHQAIVDGYMSGKISEKKLVARVKWDKHWGFPWRQYEPILELAKRRGYKVVAINKCLGEKTAQTLKQRDRFAAGEIAKIHKADPNALIYVIYGDLHLAGSHLPKLVEHACGSAPSFVIVYQDSEKLYFSLAQKGLEKRVHVLRRGNRFCVLSSRRGSNGRATFCILRVTSTAKSGNQKLI